MKNLDQNFDVTFNVILGTVRCRAPKSRTVLRAALRFLRLLYYLHKIKLIYCDLWRKSFHKSRGTETLMCKEYQLEFRKDFTPLWTNIIHLPNTILADNHTTRQNTNGQLINVCLVNWNFRWNMKIFKSNLKKFPFDLPSF